jgi:hypothetical protein
MTDKNQINILSRKIDPSEEDNSKKETRKRTKTKLVQLSVSGKKGKDVTRVKKEVKKKLTFKDFIFKISKMINSVPNFFANFFNTSFKTIAYTIVGTMLSFGAALLLFRENAGLFSVFFLTIFLAPIAMKETNRNVLLAGRTQKVEAKGVSLTKLKVKEHNKFYLKDLYEENKRTINIYLFFFIGIMLVVITLITVMPVDFSAKLFSEQGWNTALMPNRSIGFAGLEKTSIFFDILKNNFSVMIVCFIIALIFPLGALLMIVWNAMYWAVSFSQYALFYSKVYGVKLLSILFPLLLSVSLHTIIEALCYFFAVISGTMLAMSIKSEKLDSDRFFYLFRYCIILLAFAVFFLILGSFVEVYMFDGIKNFFFSLF